MNINLNQKLLALGDAYHAGKLSKVDYRIQRAIELESLKEQAEVISEKSSSGTALKTGKNKKHIMVSGVLFVMSIFIVVALLAYY